MSPTAKGYANSGKKVPAEAKDFYEKRQWKVRALDKASHILYSDVSRLGLTGCICNTGFLQEHCRYQREPFVQTVRT